MKVRSRGRASWAAARNRWRTRRVRGSDVGRSFVPDVGRIRGSGARRIRGSDVGRPLPSDADRIPSPDRGSATVWTVGAIAVLCVVFGAVLAMGQAVVVRHRAAGAADLAALAAADHWADGGTVACAQADRVVRAQHARLVRCAVEGEIADVTAGSGPGPFDTEVRSRAGPVTPQEPAASSSAPPGTVP
jgi:secretion/DNA translocation related TadE-like protein